MWRCPWGDEGGWTPASRFVEAKGSGYANKNEGTVQGSVMMVSSACCAVCLSSGSARRRSGQLHDNVECLLRCRPLLGVCLEAVGDHVRNLLWALLRNPKVHMGERQVTRGYGGLIDGPRVPITTAAMVLTLTAAFSRER